MSEMEAVMLLSALVGSLVFVLLAHAVMGTERFQLWLRRRSDWADFSIVGCLVCGILAGWLFNSYHILSLLIAAFVSKVYLVLFSGRWS